MRFNIVVMTVMAFVTSVSLSFNYYLYNREVKLKYRSKVHACETGVYLYTLRYREQLSVLEKRRRGLYIGDACANYAKEPK